MARKNDWGNYLLYGGIAAVVYVVADSMGLLNSIKNAIGMTSNVSRVSYYARPNVSRPLHSMPYSNAYIGTAYSLGQQSMSGDYNSINMWE